MPPASAANGGPVGRLRLRLRARTPGRGARSGCDGDRVPGGRGLCGGGLGRGQLRSGCRLSRCPGRRGRRSGVGGGANRLDVHGRVGARVRMGAGVRGGLVGPSGVGWCLRPGTARRHDRRHAGRAVVLGREGHRSRASLDVRRGRDVVDRDRDRHARDDRSRGNRPGQVNGRGRLREGRYKPRDQIGGPEQQAREPAAARADGAGEGGAR